MSYEPFFCFLRLCSARTVLASESRSWAFVAPRLREKSTCRANHVENRKTCSSRRHLDLTTSAEPSEARSQWHGSQAHRRHPCPHELFCYVLLTRCDRDQRRKLLPTCPIYCQLNKNTRKHKMNTKQTHTCHSRSKTPPGKKLSANLRKQRFEVTPGTRALSAADPGYAACKQYAAHVPRRNNEKLSLYLTTLQVVYLWQPSYVVPNNP